MVVCMAVFKVAGTEANVVYHGRLMLFPPDRELDNSTVVYGISIVVLNVVIAGWVWSPGWA